MVEDKKLKLGFKKDPEAIKRSCKLGEKCPIKECPFTTFTLTDCLFYELYFEHPIEKRMGNISKEYW